MTIFNVTPRPNIGAALGQGLLQGWEQQGNVNMQVKLNDMLEKKEQAKNYQGNKAIATAFGLPEIAEGSGSVSNAQFLDTMKYLKTSGQLDRIRSNRIAMMGQQELGSPIATGQENVQRPTTQQMTKQQKNLPFALSTTEAPSVIQQQPKVNQVPIVASTQPQQITPTPKRSFEEKKADIDNRFRNIYDSAQSGAEKDAAIKDRNAEMSRLINEEKLSETKRAGDIRERSQAFKESEAQRNREEGQIKPYRDKISKLRDTTRSQKLALDQADIALRSGETAGFGQYFINKYGFDPFTNPDTALLNTSGKEFLVSTLQKAGARPNQWIEQQIGSMYMKVGRSDLANKTVSEALKTENDINEKEVQLYDSISEDQLSKTGKISTDIQRDVDRQLRPYIETRTKELALRIQKLRESEESDYDKTHIRNRVQPGTPLTEEKALLILEKANNDPAKAEKIARKIGYTIPE